MAEIKQYKGRYTGPQIDELLGRVPTIEQRVSAIESGGGVGGDKTYVHNQYESKDVWTVPHKLGKRPSVSVVDRDGMVILADVHYVDENSLTIKFGARTSGIAYCN